MITIIKGNETKEFKRPDYALIDFKLEFPKIDRFLERLDGRSGSTDGGTRYYERSITIDMWIYNRDLIDNYLHQSEILSFLITTDELILRYQLMPGRQFRCRLENFEVIDEYERQAKVSFVFVMATPYIESEGDTQTALTTDVEVWGMSNGLLVDGEYSYTHNLNSFVIYNAGDVVIDPREVPFIIEFTGASTNLKIKNITTNEEWNYTKASTSNETIILDGLKTTKNGVTIFSDTNKKLITLKKGENQFSITGSSAFVIKFKTKFYYY